MESVAEVHKNGVDLGLLRAENLATIRNSAER